jgi:NitT/TauT family transport system substrate-binding protein
MRETDRGRILLDLPSRRAALKALAGGAALASGTSLLLNVARSEPIAKVRLAWAEVAACHAPIAFAVDNGLFRQRNLDVELSFHGLDGGVILEAIASGKVDLGAHLLLDWLKPLQQGQDVKIISGTHGGCQRILASKSAKIDKVEDLKGKTIAVGAIGGVSHVAFIITLAKAGLDPQADVNWRVFPFDKLGEVVNSGQADALATLDPDAYVFKKQFELVEIANTQTGVYQDRLCCAVAARGDFLRNNRDVTRRVVTALIDIHEYTAAHPDEVAAFYIARYKPAISQHDLTEVLGALTYHHHPVGPELVKEAVASVADLKLVKVLDPNIDPTAFAAKITDNILV